MMYTACTAEPCPAARRSHAAHSVQYDPCKKRPRGQSVWSTPHRRLIRNQLRQNGARHVCRGIVFHGASLPAARLYIIICSLHRQTPSRGLTPGRSPAEDQAAEKKRDIHVALFSYPAAGPPGTARSRSRRRKFVARRAEMRAISSELSGTEARMDADRHRKRAVRPVFGRTFQAARRSVKKRRVRLRKSSEKTARKGKKAWIPSLLTFRSPGIRITSTELAELKRYDGGNHFYVQNRH